MLSVHRSSFILLRFDAGRDKPCPYEMFHRRRFRFDALDSMKIVSLAGAPEEGVSHNPEIRKQVLLRRGDVPHLTNFSRSRLAPGQTASAHAHADMFEVFFVLSGSAVMRVDEGEHRLEEGACVVVEPGEAHEIRNAGADELVLLYFGVEE